MDLSTTGQDRGTILTGGAARARGSDAGDGADATRCRMSVAACAPFGEHGEF